MMKIPVLSTLRLPFLPIGQDSRRVQAAIENGETTPGRPSRDQREPQFRVSWLAWLPLLVYAAGVNPFFVPGIYDNVVYYFGAVSIAQDGTFSFQGQHITDWPPVFSALLAVPFFFGWQSVVVAKICVLLCAAVALPLAVRLFQKEQRPFPVLSVVTFALLPATVLVSTRIMSEWAYILVSVLFLHALRKVGSGERTMLAALGTGVLLGTASLTKFTGVLLGAAVLAQMIDQWLRSKHRLHLRSILPELVIAFVGASLFLAWKAKIQIQLRSGTAAEYDYYRSGWLPEHLGAMDLSTIPAKLGDLFFQAESGARVFGLPDWLLFLICAAPTVLVLIGMVARFVSKERTPSDWYVLTLLVLFSMFEGNRQTRYLLPITPFLISYGFIGLQQVLRWCRAPWDWSASWPFRFAIAAYIVALLGLASHLLLVGSLSGTHRGLCYVVSRTPESFYRGYWLELYSACQELKHASGSVAVLGGDDRYVTAFAGPNWHVFREPDGFSHLLVLEATRVPWDAIVAMRLERSPEYSTVHLYRKPPLLVHAKESSEARTNSSDQPELIKVSASGPLETLTEPAGHAKTSWRLAPEPDAPPASESERHLR